METKRIVQGAVVIIAIAIIGFAYFRLSETSGDQGNPLKHVPVSSSMVLAIDGMANSQSELELLDILLNTSTENSSYNQWRRTLHTLDSLRKAQRPWYDVLQEAPLTFAAQDVQTSSGWSLCVGLKSGDNADKLMQLWLDNAPGRSFKGTTMYVGKTLSWCAISNCLIVSPSPATLEQVIISSAAGDVVALNADFNTAFELRSKDVPLHLFAKVNERSWIQLDPVFSSKGTQLTGYFQQAEQPKHPLQLTAPAGEEAGIFALLTGNTMLVDMLCTGDADTAWNALSRFYNGSEAANYWTEVWQSVGDSCQCDLNELLLSWRTGESGTAVIALPDSSNATITFAGVRDSIDVMTLIEPLLLEPTPQTQNIFTVKFPAVLERNTLPTIPLEHNYIMQWKEYVFTASTPSQLQLIQQTANTLSKDAAFLQALQLTNDNAARKYYQTGATNTLLPAALTALLNDQENYMVSVEPATGEKSLVSIGLDIRTSATPAAVKAPEPLQALVEESTEVAQSSANSWTVINHNTNEKEQIECDEKGKLSLKDPTGKVLWTRNLGAPVLGDVVQVDALKNNKLQYVFTTKSGLYLIDRNGKDVAGFPYLPKPPITSPLLVADYDNTKKYRLIFAMGDDMILNMSIDGKMTSGWKYQPKNTGSAVKAIQSAKIGSDDVLFAVSENGSIQLLKRTGEEKSSCSTILENYNGGKISIVPGAEINGTAIVYSTAAGERTTQIQAP
ncbi:MAG: hypothetical protein ACK478_13370 [Flavobacteriales bacterium]|jgi:hypothetical protein